MIGKILETYKGKNDELFNQLARIYAATFTPDELQQIVDLLRDACRPEADALDGTSINRRHQAR